MSVFAVISQSIEQNARLLEAINRKFPSTHLEINKSAWLVASSGSAIDVSNSLGVTEGENGSAVILQISGYYGRANPNIWTWIKDNWESAGGAG